MIIQIHRWGDILLFATQENTASWQPAEVHPFYGWTGSHVICNMQFNVICFITHSVGRKFQLFVLDRCKWIVWLVWKGHYSDSWLQTHPRTGLHFDTGCWCTLLHLSNTNVSICTHVLITSNKIEYILAFHQKWLMRRIVFIAYDLGGKT